VLTSTAGAGSPWRSKLRNGEKKHPIEQLAAKKQAEKDDEREKEKGNESDSRGTRIVGGNCSQDREWDQTEGYD